MTGFASTTCEGRVDGLTEETAFVRGVWIVTRLAGGALDGVATVSGSECLSLSMAAGAHPRAGSCHQSFHIRSVRLVTGGASTLSEGDVLHRFGLPVSDLRMAALAQGLPGLIQQAIMLAAVRSMTGCASSLGYWQMHIRLAFVLAQVRVAAFAQWSRLLEQKTGESGHMWVVAGGTLSHGHGSVLNTRPQVVFQVVTVQTDLLLIDGKGRGGLGCRW